MTRWKISLGALTLAVALIAPLAGSQGCAPTSNRPESVGGTSGPNGEAPTVFAIYAVPASLDALAGETFFDHPWPSDLRIENGSPRFKGFYNPKSLGILASYINVLNGLVDGFSPAGAGYLRFTGAIDTTTLPATPKDAQDPAASVQLLDVDPSSPERGMRKLISVSFQAKKGLYYLPNTLAFMPTPGFPLRPHTRYALVVTDMLQAEDGTSIGQSETVAMLVGAKSPNADTQAANAVFSEAVGELEKAGVARADIVHLAVFTTADPTKELIAARDGVAKTADPPTADPNKWKVGTSNATFVEYQGRYGPSPNYQAGKLPFLQAGDGGQFVFENGLPVVQSVSDLRFSLTIPAAKSCPMPPAGYPIVLYAHGTGGDWQSYIDDGTARSLAARCLATMGVDQIFQGTRPGSLPGATEAQVGLTFYNFQNPIAARTNGRQAAIDEVQRARLFTESHLVVPASVSTTGADILLDATKLMVFGHSQGGLNGPLFTAIDPAARGGVFSGAGAIITIGLLDKTEPQPSISNLLRSLLGFSASNAAELDIFHPCMSLVQSLTDVVDPINYARLQVLEPRAGFAPKSVYMTEGINSAGSGDNYAPPAGIEAHAISMGLPLQLPATYDIPQVAWGGPIPTEVPAGGLLGNLADGAASGILAQWAPAAGSDGHFVIFDVPAARAQAAKFLQNLAANPSGLVPPPQVGLSNIDAGLCEPFSGTYTPACLECLAASCCDVALACFGVDDCFQYANCRQNCGTSSCIATCAQLYPMSEPAFGDMTACLQASCPDTCPF
jgi:Bacterial virulence factor lipase N-terminal